MQNEFIPTIQRKGLPSSSVWLSSWTSCII